MKQKMLLKEKLEESRLENRKGSCATALSLLYSLTTTVTVAGACRGFSQAARNAIVFTINTACLPAQRGGLIT